jgi:hypothetical protein
VTCRLLRFSLLLLLALAAAVESRAQAAGASAAASPAALQAPADVPDLDVNLAQPDVALAALPTTARIPRGKLIFRMTHRFNEPIKDAGLGGVFGLDSGAMVGLELRAGLAPGWQVSAYRTSDKTIQFSTQFDLIRQLGPSPVGVAAVASIEGGHNLKQDYSPALGLVVSHEFGTRAAAYVTPVWVNNSNLLPKELADDNSTVLVGVGTRLRVAAATYLMAEVAPRADGFKPGSAQVSFGLEQRAGGHFFQLTVTNGIGTTWAQIARGGPAGSHWYLGFNLVRKFY